MSRYIDADALIEAMGEEPYVWTDSAEEIAERNQWLTDMHIIENAPSIDIVRCKECKHGKYREEHDDYLCHQYGICVHDAEWFCADGEVRDE